MGCDQYIPGGRTGELAVAIQAGLTTVATRHGVAFVANIQGCTTQSMWDFGDGTSVTNQPLPLHAWNVAGDYPVVLTAFNETYPAGITTTTIIHVVEETHYVAQGNPTPVSPYLSWATAASNIQDAVDVCILPGATVLVSNGVYSTGGRVTPGGILTNRIVVTNEIMVQSVNGPDVTIVAGQQPLGPSAVRCAYLGVNATLVGLTLTNGATATNGDYVLDKSGGGVYALGAVLSNCMVTGNQANYAGGGADYGALSSCTLSGNSAQLSGGGWGGGGANLSTLFNCIITSNRSYYHGGGVFCATLMNCTLTGNIVHGSGGGSAGSDVSNCTYIGNSALAYSYSSEGGGSWADNLAACTVMSNSADQGGGVSGGIVTHCLLAGNTGSSGGGAHSARLVDCMLTNNTGGGAYTCNLINCRLVGNSCPGGGGGGINGGTAENCVLIGNSATYVGGGADFAKLTNCTVVGNNVSDPTGSGGGVHSSTLVNCIVYSNSAATGPNYGGSCTLNNSCTTPLPTSGTGNISDDPAFINPTANDFHLATNSPCIDSGTNQNWMLTATDLDGRPRIIHGVVDMGAYEAILPQWDTDADGVPDLWMWNHFGHLTGQAIDRSRAQDDASGTGQNNLFKYIADLDPTNPASAFVISGIANQLPGSEVSFTVTSLSRLYALECTTNLVDGVWTNLADAVPVPGNGSALSLIDTNDAPTRIYRVRIGLP